MKVKLTLLSDSIFGNGMSVPGGEDIAVLTDKQGFPFLRGSSVKGLFREELTNYLVWQKKSEQEISRILTELLGISGDNNLFDNEKIRFTDFTLSENVKKSIYMEKNMNEMEALECLSYLRTFTAIDENGMTKEGTLRVARCIKKGIIFYGEVFCAEDKKEMVTNVLEQIKWIGSMRNRGFGSVQFEIAEG